MVPILPFEHVRDLLSQDGSRIRYTSEATRDDYHLVRTACWTFPDAIHYASDRLKGNLSLAEALVDQENWKDHHYSLFSEEVKATKSFALKSLLRGGSVFEHFPHHLQRDEECFRLALNVGWWRALRMEEEDGVHRSSFEYMTFALRCTDGPETVECMEYASSSLRSSVGFSQAAVEIHADTYTALCPSMKEHRDVLVSMLTVHPSSLHLVSPCLPFFDDYAMFAARMDANAVSFLPDSLLTNESFVSKIVSANPECLVHVPNHTETVLRDAVARSPDAVRFMSWNTSPDIARGIALSAVSERGYLLAHLSPLLRATRSVVLAAVRSSLEALRFAAFHLRDDEDVVSAAVEAFPASLRHASPRQRDNPNVVWAAVRFDVSAFAHASVLLRQNVELAAFAVSIDGTLLDHVPVPVEEDNVAYKSLVMAAVRNAGQMATRVPLHCLKDENVALLCVKKSTASFHTLPVALRHNRDFVLRCVKENPLVVNELHPQLKQDPEICITAHGHPLMSRSGGSRSSIDKKDVFLEAVVVSVTTGDVSLSSLFEHEAKLAEEKVEILATLARVLPEWKESASEMAGRICCPHGFVGKRDRYVFEKESQELMLMSPSRDTL